MPRSRFTLTLTLTLTLTRNALVLGGVLVGLVLSPACGKISSADGDGGPDGNNAACAPRPVPGSLLAHWAMNEGGGETLASYTSPGLNGAIRSPSWTADALAFDGSTTYATIGNQPDLDFRRSFTLEMWIAPELVPSANGSGRLFMRGGLGDGLWGVNLTILDIKNADGTTYEGFFPSISVMAADGMTAEDAGFYVDVPGLNDGKWHHVAMARDFGSERFAFYLDGAEIGRYDPSGGVSLTSRELRIGIGPSIIGRHYDVNNTEGHTPDFYRGKIRQMMIWTAPLSPEQIMANYRTFAKDGLLYCLE